MLLYTKKHGFKAVLCIKETTNYYDSTNESFSFHCTKR